MRVNPMYHQDSSRLQEEAHWIAEAKRDPRQFAPIYNKYHEQIFRYVDQRVDDSESAFDITSQVFIKALKNIHKFEFRGVPFASWLYRIAKSEVYQSFRDKKNERVVHVDTEFLGNMMEEIDENCNEEQIQRLLGELSKLKETEIALIEMRFFEQRSYREIGEILDLTENNAKVKTFRALEKLKSKMA